MTTAFDNIIQAARDENPFFPEWGRPGNDVSLVVDRILVNNESFYDLFTGDYSASGEDAQLAVMRWTQELTALQNPSSVLTWGQRLQSFLFGRSYSAEPFKAAADRFQVIRDEFDDLVSSRISSLVNIESAISWLQAIVDEFAKRSELTEDGYEKLSVMEEYRRSFQQIAAMDQAMITKLQGMELFMDLTAAKLAMDSTVATLMDSRVNAAGR